MSQVRNFKTRGAAQRALKEICIKCVKYAGEVIKEDEDGTFSFDEDMVERLMTVEEWRNEYGMTKATQAEEAKAVVKAVKEQKAPKASKYETEGMKVKQAVAEAINQEKETSVENTTTEVKEVTTSSRFKATDAIVMMVDNNPKRENSASYARFELYRDNKTVGDFTTNGGKMADLHWDAKKGYIQIQAV